MNEMAPLKLRLATDKPLCVAIVAMGGQGGGVLADWIVALAENAGWRAQSTSVPGVAQRTGATIYYIEMLRPEPGAMPVFSLMPTPGDVDVVIAAELMEAGRAMLRGLVTPDRTTLIASTHRSLAVVEKSVPGDGEGDPTIVTLAAGVAAKRTIAFNMQAIADAHASMISAALFGALAASGALGFPRENFEAAIAAGGKGIDPSLRTFAAAYDHTLTNPTEKPNRARTKTFTPLPTTTGHDVLDAIVTRIRTDFPALLHPLLFTGVKHLVDFQDPDYATDYLNRTAAILALDSESNAYALTESAAKYIAVAMAYDDVIRVADLKTRATRFARVDREIGVKQGQLLYPTEFMHPRGAEVIGCLPAALARRIESTPTVFRLIDRIVSRPRRVRTGTIAWFLALYAVSALRPWRRSTLRHTHETAHMNQWLAQVTETAPRNYKLAVELLNARRLVKGYSDTHARGLTKFDRIMQAAPKLAPRADGADWLRRLREAALRDEDGAALDGALRTIASFA